MADDKILLGKEAEERYNQVKENGLLLFEGIVGSTSYGTNLPTSDIDKKFIYIETLDNILAGTASEQLNITDDYVGYELGRYLELLRTQNPNIIELLNTDQQHIEYIHPLFDQVIRANRDKFLTNKVAFSFGEYAKSQIKKAQGTNKKFMNPMDGPRKGLLDFCYVAYNQGSIPVKDYLSEIGVPIEYVGVSAIDHMRYVYHLFIDPSYHQLRQIASN